VTSPRILTTVQLGEIPAATYLLEPFVTSRGLTVLFGPSGTYKSFIALDWALRIATTQSAIYVAAEGGAANLYRRVDAWIGHGPPGHPHIAWITGPINLLDKRDVDGLIEEISALDWRPALLVFDTLARCMPGGDENSAQDMGRLISGVDRLRDELECAAILIHHTGNADTTRERGSSALRGAADVSIRAKSTDPLQVKLECAKVRDAAEFEPVVVRMLPIDGTLVAASAVSQADMRDIIVNEYLDAHPGASQNEVEREVKGGNDEIRAAYKRVRQVRQTPRRTPEQVRQPALRLREAQGWRVPDEGVDHDVGA
jgi:hypothetical protein